ncbi:phosphotransferase [Micromonospora sp. NPDC047557]|uniref:phosphotransferase n=1 Tax=Micromonospora sp. NPDC047557 TaxID=3364250 RepID=UPI003717B993
MRTDWAALPATITTRIADRVGGVFEVIPASSGDHAEIASTLVGPDATVFVKAACASLGGGYQSLRFEVAATQAVDGWPPAVLWQIESDGWLVVGTEHLDGPHPDLSPGSPDLEVLAACLKELQESPAPDGTWYDPATRCGFTLAGMAGGALVHSDLNPSNLIMTRRGLRIVDWAFATRAAAWVELALLVQWLIGGGHTPRQADEWVGQFPSWTATDRDVVDSFAALAASKWSTRSLSSDEGWVHDLAAWNGKWAAYRNV